MEIRKKLARTTGTAAVSARVTLAEDAECQQQGSFGAPSCSHALEANDARILKLGHKSSIVRLDQIGGGGDPTEEIITVTNLRPTFFDYLAEPPNDRIDFTITVNRTRTWVSSSPTSVRTLGVITDPPVSHSFSLPYDTFYSDDCIPTMEPEIRFGNVLPPYLFNTLIHTLIYWACETIKSEVIRRGAWPRCFRLDLGVNIDTKVMYHQQQHRGRKRKAADC